MDVSDPSSVDAFAKLLKDRHGQIDAVVNNAGVALDGFNNDVVKQTLQTNYYGTVHATRTFLALLKPGGRLVNVSSMAGKLNKYTPEIREAFLHASRSSVQDCDKLMDRFATAVRENREKEDGWPSAAYGVSKSGLTAATKAIALEESKSGKGRLVNACCPGYVNTDMTKGNGVKTVDEGARTPVMLAFGEFGGKTGEFWQSEKIIEW